MLPKEIAATTLIDAQQIIQSVPLWQNIVLGASILLALLWVNVFFQRRISLNFEINARVNLSRARYNFVFLNYFIAITYLVLVQFLAIAIWALMLRVLELIQDPTDALLFAGSCYTTIGFVSDVMPTGWKLLALFIALSGLFSIALSTAVMLNMSPLFRYAWMKKHAPHINRKLNKWHVSLPEMDMPSMAFVHTKSTSQQPTAEEN